MTFHALVILLIGMVASIYSLRAYKCCSLNGRGVEAPRTSVLHALQTERTLFIDSESDFDTIYLKTGVLRFVLRKDGSENNKSKNLKVVLDLYGILHVADSRYYQELSSRLEQYDTVLYELITTNTNVEFVNGSVCGDTSTSLSSPRHSYNTKKLMKNKRMKKRMKKNEERES